MNKCILAASLAVASLLATSLPSNAETIVVETNHPAHHRWHRPYAPMHHHMGHACTTKTVKTSAHGRTVTHTSQSCR